MIRCYQCGTENPDWSEYCDECGRRLPPVQASAPSAPQVAPGSGPPPPPTFTNETVVPKPATPYTPPPPPPPVYPGSQGGVNQAGNQTGKTMINPVGSHHAPERHDPVFSPAQPLAPHQPARQSGSINSHDARRISGNLSVPRARLVIQRGGTVGREFPLAETESLIGRWDADSGIFPDIDLDHDDPEAKISRRHARVTLVNNQYLIEDLGSTNGTFINRGPRLQPGSRQPLNNGDEIIVGKTFLRFVIN